MDEAVREYVDAITAEHRPLFDRLHAIITGEFPDAQVTLSYKMPTYKVGDRRLYLAAWRHGVSLYGWGDRDGGFVARHPRLKTSTGTIQLRPADAEEIDSEEFRQLVRAALAGGDASQ